MPDDDRSESADELVEDQLHQARQALSDATGARDAGLSDAVVVNRCYYACFHAAQAALYARGLDPESHGAVLSLFGSEIVLDGDATRAQGRLLNERSDLRRRADYEYGPVEANIDDMLADVCDFVDAMGALLGE